MNGAYHGKGTWYYVGGGSEKCEYKNGKRNGAAIEEDKDGNRFEGTYVDDVRDGRFVEKDRNGNIKAQGNYTRGRRLVR